MIVKRTLLATLAWLMWSISASAQPVIPGTNFHRMVDGTVGNLSRAYIQDPDLGTYRIGDDNEGFVAGGVLRWDYNTTRILSTISIDALRAGIGTTSTDGLILSNTTAATSGVTVQYSPRLRWTGTAWKSNATAASQTNSLIQEIRPVTGATATTFDFVWAGAAAGAGSYTTLLTLNSETGSLIIPHSSVSVLGLAFNLLTDQTGFWSDSNGLNVATAGATRLSFTPANAITMGANTQFRVATNAWVNTAPTIASGGCTAPAVTSSNGSAAFLLTIGTSCTGVKALTLTMPTAVNFWSCAGHNNTSDAAQATNVIVARATTTTAVVLTSYDRVTGLTEDFVASDTYLMACTGE